MLIVVLSAGLLVAQDATKPAPLRELSLTTPNGWWLRVLPDGSGAVGYGSLPTDAARFAAGTLDFRIAAAQLGKVTQKDGTLRTHFAVAFRKQGETSTRSV